MAQIIADIRGVNATNKGAELMLYAIAQQREQYLRDILFAAGHWSSDYDTRARLRLRQLVWIKKLRSQADLPGRLIPTKFKQMYGLVSSTDITAVLDASGFAYSDQWGPEMSEQAASFLSSYKRQGKKVILLPQAFGPFKGERIRAAVRTIVAAADLIFARDQVSFDHLRDFDQELSRIRMAPDFTNLVQGVVPDDYKANKRAVAIIPNYRMVDKTSSASSYRRFLLSAARCVYDAGLEPFMLIHEADRDIELALELKNQIDINIVEYDNPLHVKGIIGSCHSVIGSRFHGLISALSQGVPCVATGWSHKYQMLLEDYNCPECLILEEDFENGAESSLDLILDGDAYERLCTTVMMAGQVQKAKTQEMWMQVRKALDIEG